MALALAAVLGIVLLAATEPECVPRYTFDQSGEGWYSLAADGSKSYDLWRPGAGVDGSGALVLPPGVDAIFFDGPLDLPLEDVCFLGRPAGPGESPPATVWWMQHDQKPPCCLDEGCYITHFPPRAPAAELPDGFRLYHFDRAMLQGPQCDQPEVATIAVTHDSAFVVDGLGVLAQPGPDLTIAKEPQGDFVYGRQGRYVLRVTNRPDAGAALDPIRVTDTAPDRLRPIPASGSFTRPGWDCTVDGQTVACVSTGPALAPGQSAPPLELVFDLLPERFPEFTPNCARAETPGDVGPANDEACHVPILEARPDLSLSKQCFAQEGRLLQCALTVKNIGIATADDGIIVVDSIPEGLTLSPRSPGSRWSCSVETPGEVRCAYGTSLSRDTEAQRLALTFTGTVEPGVLNCARAETPGDPDPDNDRACWQDSSPQNPGKGESPPPFTPTEGYGDPR